MEAAGGEQQRVGGAAIEPLRVVDEDQSRCLGGQFGQQRQGGRADEEAVRLGRLDLPERRPQRRLLRSGQPAESIQVGVQQQMQCAEGEFGLGLDADAAHHPHPGRRGRGVLHQGGLPDTRLAPDHQRPAGARPGVGEQPIDLGLLAVTTCQHVRQRNAARHPVLPVGSAQKTSTDMSETSRVSSTSCSTVTTTCTTWSRSSPSSSARST